MSNGHHKHKLTTEIFSMFPIVLNSNFIFPVAETKKTQKTSFLLVTTLLKATLISCLDYDNTFLSDLPACVSALYIHASLPGPRVLL